MKNRFWVYAAVILAPIVLNYAFFTWHMPGVEGDANSWLGFFANYLGFIGAFSIAIVQFKVQKEQEHQSDLKSNRSFIVAHDFSAPIKLKGVNTHENSRIIVTPQYEQFVRSIPKKDINDFHTAFYKFSHFGNSEMILDCNILIDITSEDKSKKFSIDVNLGVFEKDIEVFVPLSNVEIKVVSIQKILVEYSTMKGERMRYKIDFLLMKEIHCVMNANGSEEKLMEFALTGSRWIYPNKQNVEAP